MKNRNFLFASLALILVLTLVFGFKSKGESQSGILLMRTCETTLGARDNSIIIVNEEGGVEKIELKKLNLNDLAENFITINQCLNKIKAKGYKLISATDGSTETRIMITYTFEK